MEENDRMLRVKEVAERLRKNEQTIRAWLRQGRLRGVWLGTNRAGWLIPESELQRFISEGMR